MLPDDYAICRFPTGTALPAGFVETAAQDGGVVSVTWTVEEVSILCRAAHAPGGAVVEAPWRCLRVVGPVQLALTGVLASIVSPLADARVNIFAFSTFDTDYLVVPAVRLAEALTALTGAGHRIKG